MRRAIEAAKEASSDVVGHVFWWSTCIFLL
jgi:hypothetical protein